MCTSTFKPSAGVLAGQHSTIPLSTFVTRRYYLPPLSFTHPKNLLFGQNANTSEKANANNKNIQKFVFTSQYYFFVLLTTSLNKLLCNWSLVLQTDQIE